MHNINIIRELVLYYELVLGSSICTLEYVCVICLYDLLFF